MAQIVSAAFLLVGCMCFSFSSAASSDDDFVINYIPVLMATFDCESDQFTSCSNPIGCRKINGLWNGSACAAKSLSRLNTELMAGRWYLVSSFENGDFFNYIEFKLNTLMPIGGSADFFLTGAAHSTDSFNDPEANDAIVSYDSTNSDWFILDYWGRDIGTISSIEITRTSDNLFTGCEFYLNFPDLTYQDGVCNPVRMTRGGFFKTSGRPRLAERIVKSKKRSSEQAREVGSDYRSQAKQIYKQGLGYEQ